MMRIAIVIPVFNDWQSFVGLMQLIDKSVSSLEHEVNVVTIDDSSTDLLPDAEQFSLGLAHINCIKIISLACNLGHQRAIAIGLCEVDQGLDTDAVIIMDADGEDQPRDFHRLLEAHYNHPSHIVVAQRGKRTESPGFRAFYFLYKMLFYVLTGKVIDFGNFCLIPRQHISRLSHLPELWNHLAATVAKSNITLQKVRVKRGRRYAGKSKMNMESLVLHGLSAISVYSDIVFVRIILFFSAFSVVLFMGMLLVVVVRLFTSLAIPGWATYVSGLLTILMLQALLFSAGAAFSLLNRRSTASIIPALDFRRYIRDVSVIFKLP